MTPADHLRKLMGEHGLKQKDFAPTIPQPCISRYLTESRPISWHHAVLLAKRFGKPIEIFVKNVRDHGLKK